MHIYVSVFNIVLIVETDVNFEESASYELFHPPPNQSRLIHEKNSTTASENYVDSVEGVFKLMFQFSNHINKSSMQRA